MKKIEKLQLTLLGMFLGISFIANAATIDTTTQPSNIGYGAGYASSAGAGLDYHPTYITEAPKLQRATGASSFVPTPGTMSQFVVTPKTMAFFDSYIAETCDPQPSVSDNEGNVIGGIISQDYSPKNAGNDLVFSYVVTPLSGYVNASLDTEQHPNSAKSTLDNHVAWSRPMDCVAVLSVKLKEPTFVVFPTQIAAVAQEIVSQPQTGFGGMSGVDLQIMYNYQHSVRTHDTSASSVESKGIVISGSGTPGVSGFAQGSIGWGSTNGSVTSGLVHEMVFLVVRPGVGTIKLSFSQYMTALIAHDKQLLSNDVVNQQEVSQKAVASGTAK